METDTEAEAAVAQVGPPEAAPPGEPAAEVPTAEVSAPEVVVVDTALEGGVAGEPEPHSEALAVAVPALEGPSAAPAPVEAALSTEAPPDVPVADPPAESVAPVQVMVLEPPAGEEGQIDEGPVGASSEGIAAEVGAPLEAGLPESVPIGEATPGHTPLRVVRRVGRRALPVEPPEEAEAEEEEAGPEVVAVEAGVRRTVGRIYLRSVLRFSALFSLVSGLLFLMLGGLVYLILVKSGAVRSFETFLRNGGYPTFRVQASSVFGVLFVLVVVATVLFMTACLLWAMIYNLVADASGGIEVLTRE